MTTPGKMNITLHRFVVIEVGSSLDGTKNPRMYTVPAPITELNWLAIPRGPAIDFGANSAMKSGETQAKAPTETPNKNLPIIRAKKLKIDVSIDPIVHRIPNTIIAFLLPEVATQPPSGVPMMAPMGISAETIKLKMSLSSITYLSWYTYCSCIISVTVLKQEKEYPKMKNPIDIVAASPIVYR